MGKTKSLPSVVLLPCRCHIDNELYDDQSRLDTSHGVSISLRSCPFLLLVAVLLVAVAEAEHFSAPALVFELALRR